MNYLTRFSTHATPRPVQLSRVCITSNPRLNEVRMDRLNKRAQSPRIPITVREFWQCYGDRLYDYSIATIILVTGLTFFYVAYIALA